MYRSPDPNKGENKGREVACHQLETTGKAVALELEAENKHWKADGLDLNYVKIYAVDRKGRRVFTADSVDVHFEFTGAGRLIAVDNADHYSDALFNGNSRKLHRGFAMAILRSGLSKGSQTLRVSASGLKSASLTIHTE